MFASEDTTEASTLDSKAIIDSLQETIKIDLAVMTEYFVNDIERGRKSSKRSSSSFKTVPGIYGKDTQKDHLPKSSLLTDFPDGCMAKWSSVFKNASLPTKRELLCISEALLFHDSECFFDTMKQELIARWEMLAKVTYQHSHQGDQSPIVEPAAKRQWVGQSVQQEVQEVAPEHNQRQQPHHPVIRSEMFTNNNLAQKSY